MLTPRVGRATSRAVEVTRAGILGWQCRGRFAYSFTFVAVELRRTHVAE